MEAMPYYARTGRLTGPVLVGEVPDDVPVFMSPNEPRPVGVASFAGMTSVGHALWRISVGGYDIPGLFTMVGREFKPRP